MMKALHFLIAALLSAVLVIASPVDAAEQPIGSVAVSVILKKLGAKMERDVSADQLNDYSRHFDRVDRDGDGGHSTVEYIDKGNYLTPMARRGIFNDGARKPTISHC